MSEHETCSTCSQRLDAEDQLFEQAGTIERLRMELMACGDARGIEGMEYEKKIERLREALHDSMEAAIRRDTRLRAALERIATKPPINEEYGNQGYDADEMQAMADVALQEGES